MGVAVGVPSALEGIVASGIGMESGKETVHDVIKAQMIIVAMTEHRIIAFLLLNLRITDYVLQSLA